MNLLSQCHLERSKILRNLLVLLCLVAVLMAVSAAALHTHSSGAPTDTRCTFCGIAHLSPLPVAQAETPAVAAAVFFLPPQPEAIPRAGRLHFSLYVRPPPSLTAHR
ncbi:hypothetical protein FTO74_07845 [Granulicella sp. WH15]|uniref:hypothetical protein n=1 Tax=Granulicella sp. WH15 TaxID=2602070 RepID=UPI0013672EC8|nr:hypothetical protein [Granulicella sp. WH15]QHN03286.1 hypothetical protein FTO74_07845 [Granulicella sp. WH15]